MCVDPPHTLLTHVCVPQWNDTLVVCVCMQDYSAFLHTHAARSKMSDVARLAPR